MLDDYQRAQQRQLAAERRIWQEHHRAQAAAMRAEARQQRETWRAYQQWREQEATRATAELESRVGLLRGVLQKVIASRPLDGSVLQLSPVVSPFEPGTLAQRLIPPDQRAYAVAPLTGLQRVLPTARQQHEQAVSAARERYERDWYAYQRLENDRQLRMASAEREYAIWAQNEGRRIAEYNADVVDLEQRAWRGDADAISGVFAALLMGSPSWPADFPRSAEVAWDSAAGQLLVNRALPAVDLVPAVSRIRYVKASDRENEVARPVTERRTLYREVVAQCVLGNLHEIFGVRLTDRTGHPMVQSVVFNGYVFATDPATGLPRPMFVSTVATDRGAMERMNLGQVDPISCVEGLGGSISSKPEKPVEIRPIRRPETLHSAATDRDGSDLLEMDPLQFEVLVAELFAAMGFQTETTVRSGDGGVDVVATDPDPIRGGRIIIQAKRYSATIQPSVVRDLYGTLVHEGASKGILITTSGFGPGSREFAENKPLTLIDGVELGRLLARHGVGPSRR
ncbi:restriction endonuclease [Nonomuraea sp. NPDC026600]|uniref:restriction endonuclease n=1 Tax=Nonomuraea sp. NPDC026600 TaxID=3155363 RepID=UPI0033E64E9F